MDFDSIDDEYISKNIYKFVEFIVSEDKNNFTLIFENANDGSTKTAKVEFRWCEFREYSYPYAPYYWFSSPPYRYLATRLNYEYIFCSSAGSTYGFYNYKWFLFMKETINNRDAKINMYSQNGNLQVSSIANGRALPSNLIRGSIYIAVPKLANQSSDNRYGATFDGRSYIQDAIVTFKTDLPKNSSVRYWVSGYRYYTNYSYIFKYVGNTEIITSGGFVRILPEFEFLDMVMNVTTIAESGSRYLPTNWETIF
jgi:hypothetical protein